MIYQVYQKCCLSFAVWLSLFLLLGWTNVYAGTEPIQPQSITAVCVESVNVSLDFSGSFTLLPTDIDEGSEDSAGPITAMSVSPNVFNCSQVGTTIPVLLTVTGPSGSSNCWSLVTVEDKLPPVAVCESDVFVTLSPSGSTTIDGSLIGTGSMDNCAGSLSYSLSQSTFSCADIGSAVAELTVSDASGNSNVCLTTLYVSDNLAPSAVCNSQIAVQIGSGSTTSIFPADLDQGSEDNCGVVVLTFGAGQTTYSCSDIGQSFVVELNVTDVSGLTNTCLSEVFVLGGGTPDSDCDGVANVCDVCPGGDDTIDNNADGLPDCKFPPTFSQIIPAWKCGTNKVFICRNNKTKCISYNALAAQIANGALLGPCGNATCTSLMPIALAERDEQPVEQFDTTPTMTLATDGTTLNIALYDHSTEGQLMVTDQLGRILSRQNVGADTDNVTIALPARAAGMYVVTLQIEGLVLSERIMLGH
jgi:hypothetical protein